MIKTCYVHRILNILKRHIYFFIRFHMLHVYVSRFFAFSKSTQGPVSALRVRKIAAPS